MMLVVIRFIGISIFSSSERKMLSKRLALQKTLTEPLKTFFVNGMPCDHVNELLESGEQSLAWRMAEDIHLVSFKKDTRIYYLLRKSVMDGMLETTGLKLDMLDQFNYRIELA